MRVVCQMIDEFFENLTSEPKGSLFRDTIRINNVRQPLDGNRFAALKFQIIVQVSAVVDLGEDGQYLLEAAEDCGIDYADASQEKEGTEQANELRLKINQECEKHAW